MSIGDILVSEDRKSLKIGVPKIGMDFNRTFKATKETTGGYLGPPEMCESLMGDIWLLGQVLYELVALKSPIETSNDSN